MDNMNESVGKKIVEALKRQAESDISPSLNTTPVFQTHKRIDSEPEIVKVKSADSYETQLQAKPGAFGDIFAGDEQSGASLNQQKQTTSSILDESFDSVPGFNNETPSSFPVMDEPAQFEMPSNIVVLKKLISQLPSGVSRHTGAQIIKQTMEALGISMRSVLQDAQQFQDNLKNSARECQSYIQEYKKQIVSLEKQSQNYQKQYAALNDLISLFIQANK